MAFDKPPRFNRRTTNHVIETVQRVEAMPYPSNRPPPVFVPRASVQAGIIEAIVGTAITPFNTNTNTYGSGTCTPYVGQFNTNTNSYQQVVDTSFGNSATVLSHYTNNGNSIATGQRITVATRNGYLLLVGSDC